jgi:hypothetical protein
MPWLQNERFSFTVGSRLNVINYCFYSTGKFVFHIYSKTSFPEICSSEGGCVRVIRRIWHISLHCHLCRHQMTDLTQIRYIKQILHYLHSTTDTSNIYCIIYMSVVLYVITYDGLLLVHRM